jgi:hypothetical protein
LFALHIDTLRSIVLVPNVRQQHPSTAAEPRTLLRRASRKTQARSNSLARLPFCCRAYELSTGHSLLTSSTLYTHDALVLFFHMIAARRHVRRGTKASYSGFSTPQILCRLRKAMASTLRHLQFRNDFARMKTAAIRKQGGSAQEAK